ncbi:ParB/RepB/Spo0J family partition protein [Methylacidimicrobium tartarophylax]|uniref:Chromosome-partitioning protein Spo0J n=1 Tax=Methylacidimicrobium tartarophylax TaxID=1041768 RepID=A0A5E6MH89_9BACT|nr:ParB/RepB/Spo0J family partition protein [Methylacidimicrobium tartarophylax]VVM04855.1 Chromosome-partitioning protein Spo0J [Methylacidimicrobium tartarophylax]
MAQRGLGRGLDVLLARSGIAAPEPDRESGERIERLPIDRLVSSPYQPRKTFTEEALEELAGSIRERGILQPLIVRRAGEKYEIIAGERRWRAAKRTGLSEVPAIVRPASDQEMLELALIENLQRSDLPILEEARGYALLQERFSLTQEAISQKVGKDRSTVANALRLLSLENEVQELLASGQLAGGHGKAILGLAAPADRLRAARQIARQGLSVRQAEALVEKIRREKSGESARPSRRREGVAAWRELERRLRERLGTRVRVCGKAERGRIEISYVSAEQLDRLLRSLGLVSPSSTWKG